MYGEAPPLTKTVIDPPLLEHVEPCVLMLTEVIPFGDVNVVPATIVHKAASVTWKDHRKKNKLEVLR